LRRIIPDTARKRASESVELSVALSLLLVLVAAFAAVRYTAKARRKKMLAERERQRRRRPTYKPRSMSSRAEMRAYDDPSTLAGDITTFGTTPTTDQAGGGDGGAISSPPRAADRAGARARTPTSGKPPDKPRT
jgi:hypothetical protein